MKGNQAGSFIALFSSLWKFFSVLFMHFTQLVDGILTILQWVFGINTLLLELIFLSHMKVRGIHSWCQKNKWDFWKQEVCIFSKSSFRDLHNFSGGKNLTLTGVLKSPGLHKVPTNKKVVEMEKTNEKCLYLLRIWIYMGDTQNMWIQMIYYVTLYVKLTPPPPI